MKDGRKAFKVLEIFQNKGDFVASDADAADIVLLADLQIEDLGPVQCTQKLNVIDNSKLKFCNIVLANILNLLHF